MNYKQDTSGYEQALHDQRTKQLQEVMQSSIASQRGLSNMVPYSSSIENGISGQQFGTTTIDRTFMGTFTVNKAYNGFVIKTNKGDVILCPEMSDVGDHIVAYLIANKLEK